MKYWHKLPGCGEALVSFTLEELRLMQTAVGRLQVVHLVDDRTAQILANLDRAIEATIYDLEGRTGRLDIREVQGW